MATISYYDGLDYPLTGVEVHLYVVNPRRLVREAGPVPEFSLGQVLAMLDELVEASKLEQHKGMYMLAGRGGLAEQRLEREKIAAQKWRTLRRRARWLQAAPWVRGIFVSGSMALGNTTPESDFDMLVIVQAGRLYAARLLLSALTSVMRARRTRYERVAPDKFCFNHYITTDHLTIEHPSLYNAQTYAHLVPLHISRDLAGKFFAANLWVHQYVYNFTPGRETAHREIKEQKWLQGIARGVEKIVDATVGNMFERRARAYQQGRIDANPATHASGGRVAATDTELEFHPRSFERTVLERYNAAARRLKFADTIEPDSGLN